MNEPIEIAELVTCIQELYRPSLRGHWQRRVINRVRRWLGREDASLFWSEEEEQATPCGFRLALPERTRAPRWICLGGPLAPEVAVIAQVLVGHLATVVTLMEAEAAPPEIPARWRARLTQRQIQVALLAAEGGSNDDIAAELGIAPRTVARLLQETFLRLEVSNRTALAAECALGRPPTPFFDSQGRSGL